VASFFVGGGLGALIASQSYGRPIPSSQLVAALWVVVVLCQVAGWYMGMRWRGEVRATVGLGLVFMPPYVAALATFSRRRG
jgi:peptidoglycan/LPS O-acetylase OafA/YrhL